MKLLDELKREFKPFGYVPQHPEIYRALHELLEQGILKRGKIKKDGSKYQEIAVYFIRDTEKANAYKKLIKHDLDRGYQLMKKALADNYQ